MRSVPLSPDIATALPDLVIRRAEARDTEALAGLAPHALLARLAEGSLAPGDHHLVGWLGNVPAGLLVSRPDVTDPETQDVVSLMVTPLFRRRGIGRALLEHLALDMRARGRNALSATWSDRIPNLGSFSAALVSAGWSTPSPRRLRMSFNAGDRLEALALAERRIAAARAAGLSSISLDAAGPQARAMLISRSSALKTLLPKWADPAPWLATCDAAVSQLLLNASGEVCGWLLAEHQPASGRWLAPIGWSETGASHMMLAMAAWLEALERTQGASATVILHPTLDNGSRVCRLLDRHFRPHALWADCLIASRKPLGD